MTIEMPVDSWAEYKELISDWIHSGILGHEIWSWVFRGHNDQSHRLIAGLDRRYEGVAPELRLKLYKETLRKLAESGELPGSHGMAEADIGGILQHYGTPTRLLDWTRSPYVAAYFAFLATATFVDPDDDPEDCAVWCLWRESPAWNAQDAVSIVGTRYDQNSRAQAQRGYFTQNMSLEPDLEVFLAKYHEEWGGDSLVKVTMPRDEASFALRELELMGIDSNSLFPGVEGASRHAFFRAQDQMGLL